MKQTQDNEVIYYLYKMRENAISQLQSIQNKKDEILWNKHLSVIDKSISNSKETVTDKVLA